MIQLTDNQANILFEIIEKSQNYIKNGDIHTTRYLNRLILCITDKSYKKILGHEHREEIRKYIYKHCFNKNNENDYNRWMAAIFPEDYKK